MAGFMNPEHPEADDDGFRQDVLAFVKAPTCLSSVIRAEIFYLAIIGKTGGRAKRPTSATTGLAWKTLETNQFGTNEFATWAKKARRRR